MYGWQQTDDWLLNTTRVPWLTSGILNPSTYSILFSFQCWQNAKTGRSALKRSEYELYTSQPSRCKVLLPIFTAVVMQNEILWLDFNSQFQLHHDNWFDAVLSHLQTSKWCHQAIGISTPQYPYCKLSSRGESKCSNTGITLVRYRTISSFRAWIVSLKFEYWTYITYWYIFTTKSYYAWRSFVLR